MRRAAALPTVLFALCLIGALTVGGSHVSRRLADDARVERQASELGPLAEEALAEVVGGWVPVTSWALLPGAVWQASEHLRSGVRIRVWVSRLAGRDYWLVAEAVTTRKPLLQKRLAVLLQVDSSGVQLAPQVAWFELP